MSVYQVEEYYICTTGKKINSGQKLAIEKLLGNEGYLNYEIQEGGKIIVDDIPSKEDGNTLEDAIYEIIRG